MRSALPKFVSSILIVLASLYPAMGVAQGKESATQLKLAPGTDAVNAVQVARIDQAVSRVASARGKAPEVGREVGMDTTSDHKTGTILATLVLMVAIAIRRYSSRRR